MPVLRTLDATTRAAIAWRKSSRSPSNGGNCVEVGARPHHGIAVRDSKHPTVTPLTITRSDWAALLHTVSANT